MTVISHIQDSAYASPAVAQLIRDYHEAKSRHDVEATMSFFSRDNLVYSDATLGTVSSWDSLHDLFSQYMPAWGEGVSYATAVLGNEHSAVVVLRDSPELFGAEILALAAVDFGGDGKITRWVDYWDSRHFGLTLAAQMRTPLESFPESFGEENTPGSADPEMNDLVERLITRLSRSDATGAGTMFAVDAVLEDVTTHTAVRGRAAIERYLTRVIAQLPYGAGASVRRVLGSATSGGFEWVNPGSEAKRGISAVSLDGDGNIVQMLSVWDGAMVGDQTLSMLTLAALEPSNN
jgi:hypothetical protein